MEKQFIRSKGSQYSGFTKKISQRNLLDFLAIVHTFVTKFGFILRYIHHNVISWENDLENSVTGDFSV